MPTVVIRPDGDITVGNFSNTPVTAVLSDSDDTTFTNNTTTNQVFEVSLDDVSLSGATFNSFILTTRAKRSGKGNAEWNAQLQTSGGSALCDDDFTSTSTSYADFNSSSTSFSGGFSESDVNGLKVRIETINSRQCFFAEVFVTIDYTAAASGPSNLISYSGIRKENITSINGITIANVTSINGVS